MRGLAATTAGVLTLVLLSPATGDPVRPSDTTTVAATVAAPLTAFATATATATPADEAPQDDGGAWTDSGRLVTVGGPAALDPDVTAMLDACDPTTENLAGPDRFATAAAVSEDVLDEAVIVTSGRNFPDALAAAALVDTIWGVLLTEPDELPAATARAIGSANPTDVIVLGGTDAVSEDVFDELAIGGADVTRIAGADRFDTAARLAADRPTGGVVHLANGRRFADALALGPVAVANDGPILLVEQDQLPAATADALRALAPSRVIVAGGPAAVADDVLDVVRDLTDATVDRVAGSTRYATAAALAAELPDSSAAVVVSGRDFPDTLAAGPLAARLGGPLLLVDQDLDPAVARDLTERRGWDCRPVTVLPSATEGLTLGPRAVDGPAPLTASVDDVSVAITDPAVGATLLLDGAATVTMAYPPPPGGVDDNAVVWDELLGPTDTLLEVQQPWRNQLTPPPQDLTVAWQYTGDSARYRQEVAAAPGLNVTAPFRYFLRTDGTVGDSVDPAFIADMHARGVQVWPTIHAAGAEGIAAALTDPDRRRAHALAISRSAEAAGADGVNIDIEGFPVSLRDAVTDFTQIIAEDIRRWGGVSSYDLTSMTDSWITPPPGYEFWSTGPDRRAIADAVDYSVLMAYDQYNRFRPRGPVASDAWVEEALRYQLRYSDPDRILLGLPLYARIWRGDTPSAVGQTFLKDFIAGGTSAPDGRFGVPRVVGADGRVTWAETADRLSSRLDLVEQYGLAGTASWRLGFDDPATWQTLGQP